MSLSSAWWRLVFAFKHRGGWVDLKKDIVVTGTVLSVTPPGEDGDINFNLKLDPAYSTYNQWWEDGHHTTENPDYPDTIHCEVVPWSRGVGEEIVKVGAHVRVAGRWGFDGVHSGRGTFVDVFRCLTGAAPRPNGWFEIHPVAKVEAL